MSRGYSRVVLIGNLGADPDMRYLPGGDPVTNFSIAVNRRRTVNGEPQDETDWYRVNCYRRNAEVADQYLRKGSQVLVDGQLLIRKYTGNDGNERTSVEVNCDSFTMLGGKPDEQQAAKPAAAGDVPYPDQVPF